MCSSLKTTIVTKYWLWIVFKKYEIMTRRRERKKGREIWKSKFKKLGSAFGGRRINVSDATTRPLNLANKCDFGSFGIRRSQKSDVIDQLWARFCQRPKIECIRFGLLSWSLPACVIKIKWKFLKHNFVKNGPQLIYYKAYWNV